MKYSIAGFSQPKLIEYKLDINDAYILRWFVDFLPKMSRFENDGCSFYWVKYQQVIDDLPTLKITNREVMSRRFNKLVDAGIMKKFVSQNGGNFTCFALSFNYLSLVEVSTQKSTPIDSKVDTPIDSKVDTKDSSIKEDSSIKLNSDSEDKSSSCGKKCLLNDFEQFNQFTTEEQDSIRDWVDFRCKTYHLKKTKHALTILLNDLLKVRQHHLITEGTGTICKVVKFFKNSTYQNIHLVNFEALVKKQIAENRILGEQQ